MHVVKTNLNGALEPKMKSNPFPRLALAYLLRRYESLQAGCT